MEAFISGPRYRRKKAATSASKLAAIVSMIATSLTKTDPPGAARSLIAAAYKAVPHAACGADERRMPRVVAKFLADATDQHVNRSIVRIPVDTARLVHDPVASQNTTSVPHQQAEQLEFRRCQRDHLTVKPRRRCGPIHLQGSDPDSFVRSGRSPTPQNGLHAGQ